MAKEAKPKNGDKTVRRPQPHGGALQNGGPGRPPGTVSLASLLKKRLAENPGDSEAIVTALIKHALGGNAQMMKMVLDRVDGALINTVAVNLTQNADLSKLSYEQLAALERVMADAAPES